MGNFKKKIDKKLKGRIESYEDIPVGKRRGYIRPGSRNPKKQGGNAPLGVGKRR